MASELQRMSMKLQRAARSISHTDVAVRAGLVAIAVTGLWIFTSYPPAAAAQSACVAFGVSLVLEVIWRAVRR